MPCIICKWNLTGTLCTSGALRGTLRERFEPLREAPLPSPFTNGDNSPRSGSRFVDARSRALHTALVTRLPARLLLAVAHYWLRKSDR